MEEILAASGAYSSLTKSKQRTDFKAQRFLAAIPKHHPELSRTAQCAMQELTCGRLIIA